MTKEKKQIPFGNDKAKAAKGSEESKRQRRKQGQQKTAKNGEKAKDSERQRSKAKTAKQRRQTQSLLLLRFAPGAGWIVVGVGCALGGPLVLRDMAEVDADAVPDIG